MYILDSIHYLILIFPKWKFVFEKVKNSVKFKTVYHMIHSSCWGSTENNLIWSELFRGGYKKALCNYGEIFFFLKKKYQLRQNVSKDIKLK